MSESGLEHSEGERVDRYKLIRPLGQGGMGEVWVAENAVMGALVALKFLGRHRSSSAQERLLREARAAARVRHPACVQVFDVGVDKKGDPFLVMELLDGLSLADLLEQRGALEVRQAVELGAQVADALSAAHELGIVHRDVKPDNVMLVEVDGRKVPKLLDFGVARSTEDAVKLTLDGSLVGTPAYMAPEQITRAETSDPRIDVWGLTVTLYEMIVGTVPFSGSGLTDVLASVTRAEPLWPGAVPGLDTALWRIIDRGLAKDRSARFQSAAELSAALKDWLAQQSTGAEHAKPEATSTLAAPEEASVGFDAVIFASLGKERT